jgi:hypothetical protein
MAPILPLVAKSHDGKGPYRNAQLKAWLCRSTLCSRAERHTGAPAVRRVDEEQPRLLGQLRLKDWPTS